MSKDEQLKAIRKQLMNLQTKLSKMGYGKIDNALDYAILAISQEIENIYTKNKSN